MSKEQLLKFANDGLPADFTKEFKMELDKAVQKKLFPEQEEETEEEDNENN